MKSELSERELSVLKWAVRGYTDDMIARELAIERGTVNSYWVRIRGKLGHLSRTELVARYVQSQADIRHNVQNDAAADILARANAEIDRLQQLLDKRDRGE